MKFPRELKAELAVGLSGLRPLKRKAIENISVAVEVDRIVKKDGTADIHPFLTGAGFVNI